MPHFDADAADCADDYATPITLLILMPDYAITPLTCQTLAFVADAAALLPPRFTPR